MSKAPAPRFTIGTLATQAGVSVDTVRHYEKEGVLPAPQRTAAGYRIYGKSDVQRIGFVRRARELGFSLEEIRDLLRLEGDRDHGVSAIRERTRARLHAIEQHIQHLQTVRDRLGQLVAACPGSGEPECCPILSTIYGSAEPVAANRAGLPPAAVEERTTA